MKGRIYSLAAMVALLLALICGMTAAGQEETRSPHSAPADGTAMTPGIPASEVGVIVAAVVTAMACAGYGVIQKAKAVRIDPQPLEVRDAELHYVTHKQHEEDLKRIYDLYYETSAQLNQLIGLVSAIRDSLKK